MFTVKFRTNPKNYTKQQVLATLKHRMALEFLNRIDETILFLPLSPEDIRKTLR